MYNCCCCCRKNLVCDFVLVKKIISLNLAPNSTYHTVIACFWQHMRETNPFCSEKKLLIKIKTATKITKWRKCQLNWNYILPKFRFTFFPVCMRARVCWLHLIPFYQFFNNFDVSVCLPVRLSTCQRVFETIPYTDVNHRLPLLRIDPNDKKLNHSNFMVCNAAFNGCNFNIDMNHRESAYFLH